mmetsp:Transcript_25657/g.55877  ORF Transcript_25657/g.55877 Transcript_25657/m.55877 type:complete len:200 (-) Transcript_25657:329-928(-)
MMAIFSLFSAPLMLAGSTRVLTATTVPRQMPLYTLPNVPSPSICSVLISRSSIPAFGLRAILRRSASMRSTAESSRLIRRPSCVLFSGVLFPACPSNILIKLYCRTSSASSRCFSSLRFRVVSSRHLLDSLSSCSAMMCCMRLTSTEQMRMATSTDPITTPAIVGARQLGIHSSSGMTYSVQVSVKDLLGVGGAFCPRV